MSCYDTSHDVDVDDPSVEFDRRAADIDELYDAAVDDLYRMEPHPVDLEHQVAYLADQRSAAYDALRAELGVS